MKNLSAMKTHSVLLLLTPWFCLTSLFGQPDRIWALPDEQSLPAPPYGDQLIRTGPDGNLTIAYNEYFSGETGEDPGDIFFFRIPVFRAEERPLLGNSPLTENWYGKRFMNLRATTAFIRTVCGYWTRWWS